MKLSFTILHGLSKIFLTAICIIFSFFVSAQKQYISGKGIPGFSNVKNARTQKKFPADLSPDFNLAERNIHKWEGKNLLKRIGNSTVNPLDSTNISFGLYSCADYCYDSSNCGTTASPVFFYSEIWTAYPNSSSDVTLIIDFGDGNDTTLNPTPGYWGYDSIYYDSTYFHVFLLHSYLSAGNYYPSCTVITTAGDTSIYTYYDPLIIYNGNPFSSSIDQFYVYSDQYCWGDTAYYNTGDSLYYYGTSFNFQLSAANLQSLNDNFIFYINYGNGNDTTINITLNEMQYWYWGWWSGYCLPFVSFYNYYTYPQAGTYNIFCSVTFPDGTTDTASSYAIIADQCVTFGGKVFIDNNSNCIPDSAEAGIPDIWLYIPYEYDSVNYSDPCDYYYYGYYNWAYTDSLGNYRFSVPDICQKSDTIRFDPYYNFYPVVNLPLSCPSSGYYVFNTSNPQLDYDFALGCASGYDLQGFLWGWRFRPGFQGYIYPHWGNYQCDSVSGTAKLVIDNPGFLTIDSIYPTPTSVNGDTISWDFSDISILDWWNYATVYATTDTAANDGDTIHTTLILEPISGDSDTSNNIISQDFIVSNSWDPNEKESFPRTNTPEGFIKNNQDLTYIIHFQNTGSDTAYNVSISDTIDPDLNLSSIKILTSSHYMQFYKENNIATFSFPNIMLPDSSKDLAGSQGFVSYRIEPKSNLPEATEINNTAYIYFDYNPAVITNTTLNTITYFTEISENSGPEYGIKVFPNPAKTELFIQFNEIPDDASIIIFDMLGKKIHTQPARSEITRINSSGISAGVYFMQVQNQQNSFTYKIVITSENR